MRYNVVMLLVTEGPGELACAVVVTILLMMTLLTIVLTLHTLLSAGHRQQVSQLGPELRLSPLEDGAVTIADHGQAHHHGHLVLDTPQQHPDDVSSLITTQQHLMLSAQVVV